MEPKPKSHLPKTCIPRDVVMKAAMLRLGNIDDEVQAGYNIIRKYHKTATIFGSARTAADDPNYLLASQLAAKLVEKHYAIVSGGGHGIMGAANKGAFEAGGDSIGFNIELPHEQNLNPWTTESLAFSHFAPRKIAMTLFANAYIYFPGGFGTMDELSEIITLMQTGKTNRAPIILFDSKFWKPYDTFVRDIMHTQYGTISRSDVALYTITDDIDEVVRIVEANQTYCEHNLGEAAFQMARETKSDVAIQ
jgi:uncharacterized protein (TIGR00730 family)